MSAEFAAHIREVALALCGEPNRKLSSKEELRFGTNGSLRVSIAGQHEGTWKNHETDEGGGTLDLIVHKRGGDRASAAEWFKQQFGGGSERQRIVATYRYTDAHGNLVHEVVRYDPKSFKQRRPDGNDGYIWNLSGIPPTLYNLPKVAAAAARGELVLVVEGEKDADRLNGLGFVATCNAGGAGKGKWKPEHSEQLKGARVAILPDNDTAGAAHAEAVAAAMAAAGTPELKIVRLDVAADKADVSDWLAAGGTPEQLRDLIEAAPAWRPTFKPALPLVWFGQEDAAGPLRWLVRGLLVDGGLSVVYGPPKSSKTFVALDLALNIAHGREWYGLPVKQGGVLYVSGEGQSGVRQRMKAWRKEHDGDDAPPLFAMVPRSINLFDNEDDVGTLIDLVKDVAEPMGQPVALVVFDTLARMMGSGDEDRARDINVIVNSAERIQRETGAHVMIVHHSGKDRDRGMRGSNALLGAVDTAIEVTKDAETKLCKAKVTAIKDGGEIGPFAYTLRQTAVGMDEEGHELLSCVIDPAGATQGVRTAKLSQPEERALALLRDMLRDNGDMLGQNQNVPVGTWRDKFRDTEQGEFETRKKRAYRSTKSLIDKGIVQEKNGLAYLLEDEEW